MNKFTTLASAVVLAFAASAAVAAPSGFGPADAPNAVGGPQGFNNAAPNTVRGVLDHGYDDQHVVLTGRLVNYLGHDRYEFADNTGSIEVELDDDRSWSHISKGQLITIYGEVDRDLMFVTIDVKDARAAQ